MRTRLLWVLAWLTVSVACDSGSSTGPSADASPSGLPDLSAPQRFRPFITGFVASPQTIKVGETASITGSVRTGAGVPSPDVSWVLFAEPASVGNGILSELSGSGDLGSRFQANYKGDVTLVAYAIDSKGVPSMPSRTALTVVP